ncbi:MAG: barstar family protein [Proteobacteria bacterium]|nr:barstar family protein [Pseudomonadota bacterium]MCL2308499.1 barstar family protein [Pseudomonadota bacterium]
MKPFNLDDLNRVGIHPLKTPEAVARFTEAREKSALHYFAVDIADVHNKVQLLKQLAETLEFPDYFGHNWDALYDVLCDEAWFGDTGIVLHLKHTTSFEKLAADDWLTLCETLKEAIDYWRSSDLPFWVFVDHTRDDARR